MPPPPSSPLQNLLSWLVVLLVPVALVLTAVRLLLTPIYVQIEYRMPEFPVDTYGFTFEDRLHWAPVAIEYLLNDAGIEFLGDLKFDNGDPLYNARELRHMVDVKNVVTSALRIWAAAWGALALLGVWAWRANWLPPYARGLKGGGWLTIGLLGGIILFVAVAFGIIFVGFHQVFFESGTWTFLYSDTLIRLFPERFWQDTFIAVGLLSMAQAAILIWLSGRLKG